ncbi:MAG: tRNA pseudouridine(55) synthase TruB, partial [Pseudomonadota bacterium]
MGRIRKGRNVSGWLVIDKPAGMTSNAVVNEVRRAMNARKAGHAGTLDPQATGVLAVALGEATKTAPYVTDALKAYEFTIRLGQARSTDDAEGEVIAESDFRPTDDALRSALPAFEGEIMQVPPKFSAIKIGGRRAYELARKGELLKIAARPLWVKELQMLVRPDPDHVVLRLICGKGGYVRAVARDLGAALGCHGHVCALRRIWSGPFRAEDGLSMRRIRMLARTRALDSSLKPLELGLAALPELHTTAEGAARLRNG